MTRAQNITVFHYLRDKFLKTPVDSPLYLALEYNGIDDLADLMAIPIADFDKYKYIPTPSPTIITPAGVAVPLHTGHMGKLKILIKWTHYIVYDLNFGNNLSESEWLAIKPVEFDEFRSDPANAVDTTPSSSIAGQGNRNIIWLFR